MVGNPNWKKGQSGNPKGRPKKPFIEQLEFALRKEGRARGVKFFQHVAQLAYTSESMAIAVLKKILPDLKQVESKIKLEVELIPMTIQEKLGYDKLAEELAQQEIKKQLEEGEDEEPKNDR